jgi:hypothetical protein
MVHGNFTDSEGNMSEFYDSSTTHSSMSSSNSIDSQMRRILVRPGYLPNMKSSTSVSVHSGEFDGEGISWPYRGDQSNSKAPELDKMNVLPVLQEITVRDWQVEASEARVEKSAGVTEITEISFIKSPEEASKVVDPVNSIDELWLNLYHRGQLRSLSNKDKTMEKTIKDWSGYLTKGDWIGGGAFGDVYAGIWVDAPEFEGRKLPQVVLKVMRDAMKQAVHKGQDKVNLYHCPHLTEY